MWTSSFLLATQRTKLMEDLMFEICPSYPRLSKWERTSYNKVQPHRPPSWQLRHRSGPAHRRPGTWSCWCWCSPSLGLWRRRLRQESSLFLVSASTLPWPVLGGEEERDGVVLLRLAWLLFELKAEAWVAVLQAMLGYIANRLSRHRQTQVSRNRSLRLIFSRSFHIVQGEPSSM